MALLACTGPFASGCERNGSARKNLLLYCAAGIRPPIAEMAEQFGKEQGIVVECDYAGSAVLLSRIKLMQRGDLYIPGDAFYVQQAENEGLIASSRNACYLVPVILVRKSNPQGVKGLKDLTRAGLRVGLGDAKACTIGRQSAELFRKNGIAEEDVNKNVVFRSLTVNELGIHVEMGEIDAAIVWDATAAYYPDTTDVVPIPREQNILSSLPISVLKCTENKDLAEKFVEFATSERGAEIFRRHHYTTQIENR